MGTGSSCTSTSGESGVELVSFRATFIIHVLTSLLQVMMKIQGAVALVTGAVKGCGRAFCAALLERGAASVSEAS